MQKLNKRYLSSLVARALNEDIKAHDITAELILKSSKSSAYILCRENAVICGTAFVDETFRQLNPKVKIDWLIFDGDKASQNQILCFISGPSRALLSGERTALNFLQTLSGTATSVRKHVEIIKNTKTKLLDTRKTIPGFRLAQKYAVVKGGGGNHRLGLYDAFLIKENHLKIIGSIKDAIKKARKKYRNKLLEIEVKNLKDLKEAISAKPDLIMLDNFSLKNIEKAVVINSGKIKLEASGNITCKNIKEIAKTGVDFISMGAFTKNVKAIDLSMLIE